MVKDFGNKISPFLLERYELKFTIPFDMIEPISEFVSIYCSSDKYSTISDDNFYKVNNIYYDSPSFYFLKNRLERAENRFNMRVRSYGDNPDNIFFLEVKQKRDGIIKKYRSKIDYNEWDCKNYLHNIDSDSHNNKILFYNLAHKYGIEPKIATEYTRKAYVSQVDDYGRVTFDTNLRYVEKVDNSLDVDRGNMSHYDFCTNFITGGDVILELKCYSSNVPYWMIDLIRMFNLKRTSFSKYVTGVREVMSFNNLVALN